MADTLYYCEKPKGMTEIGELNDKEIQKYFDALNGITYDGTKETLSKPIIKGFEK